MQYNLQGSLLTNLEIRNKKNNFKKPNSWPNIRKNVKDNSIRLLADNRYPLGFTATCSGGYSVDIDGEHYADYNSQARFSMAAANWQVDADLPNTYKRIAGISMDNNCYYVITDFKLQGSDTLKFSFSASAACNVIGCYTTGTATNNYSLYVGTNSGAKYMRYNGSTYDSMITADTKYNIVMTPSGATGLTTSPTWDAKTFTSSTDMCIGTTSTGATSSKLVGTLYGNIEVVGRLNLIPCERVSDNVLGYYDTVSETFYEPTGTPTSTGYDTSHLAGYAIDYPTGATRVHIIDIYPQTEGAEITAFHCARVAASDNEQQGVLWAHFNISNGINLSRGFAYTEYYNDLLTAVTAKNNLIIANGLDYCFNNALNLEYLPKINYSNVSDMTNFITKATSLNINIDVSENNTITKIGCYGTSTYFMGSFKELHVSNSAPFDNSTSPQINVSYTGLNKAALMQLFNELPTVTNEQIINITGCAGNQLNTVGSPTITDGIASGFSGSNYYELDTAIPSTINSADIIFRAKVTSFDRHSILLCNKTAEKYFAIKASNHSFSIYNGSWTTGINNSITTNTWYWYRVIFDGTNYKGYTIEDNNYTQSTLPSIENWTLQWTTASDGAASWIKNTICAIGLNVTYPSEYFTGSIDLNETYIIVNHQTLLDINCCLLPEDKAIATNKGWTIIS